MHRILYEPNNDNTNKENRMFLDDRIRASACRAGWLGGARQREKRQPQVSGPQATHARRIRFVRFATAADRARKNSPRPRGSKRKRRTGESSAGASKSRARASVSESRRSVEARDTGGNGYGRGRAPEAAWSDYRRHYRNAGNGRRAGAAWTSAGHRLARCAGKAG